MKKAYKDLLDISEKLSSENYSNYSNAVSTVATRRLLLDALMALRKRVVAARVRARAEIMEMNLKEVATNPNISSDNDDNNDDSESTNPESSSSVVADGLDNGNNTVKLAEGSNEGEE